MKKAKIVKKSKEQLIEIAQKNGFFKKEGVSVMYARTNGHFYYTTPPAYVDGHDTVKIERSDVETEKVDYPLNGKETAGLIENCTSQEEIDALIKEGQLLENDARKGVIKALEEKKEELSSKDD